jgi:hypothetical protein
MCPSGGQGQLGGETTKGIVENKDQKQKKEE